MFREMYAKRLSESNIADRIVRFWSQSPKALESMMELFEDTFGLPLLPESPAASAISLGLTAAQQQALDTALKALRGWKF